MMWLKTAVSLGLVGAIAFGMAACAQAQTPSGKPVVVELFTSQGCSSCPPAAAARQARYVDTLNLSSAFTPQVVIDGRASYVGSDRRRILAALANRQEEVPVAVEVSPSELTISLPERAGLRGCDVNLVAYLPQASTAIGRGENSGRTLVEFNIVREFRRVATWDGKPSVLRLPLASFPADASRVAVFLQRSNQGNIVGSAVATLRAAPAPAR
jgi:hypothetical protein